MRAKSVIEREEIFLLSGFGLSALGGTGVGISGLVVYLDVTVYCLISETLL